MAKKKLQNIFNPPKSNVQFTEGQKSKGILDDFAVRKALDTIESSIERLKVDHIAEKTAGHGVVFDNVIKTKSIILGTTYSISHEADADIGFKFSDTGMEPLTGIDLGGAIPPATATWKDLYLSGDATIGGDIDATGDITGSQLNGVSLVVSNKVFTGWGGLTAPTHTFIGRAGTGMWSSAVDTLNFSAGGTEILELDETSADLTVPLNVAPDTDIVCSFGRAKIGHFGWSDYAGFAHYDQMTSSTLALMQSATGVTYVTSAGALYLRIGSTVYATVSATDFKVENAVKIKERASAVADTAAYGQLWVKTATPNVLMFTDDAGNDYTVNLTAV